MSNQYASPPRDVAVEPGVPTFPAQDARQAQDITQIGVSQRTPIGRPRYHYQTQRMGRSSLHYWELRLLDLSAGLNTVYGDFEREFDRSLSSTLYHEERTLCLPPLTTTAATPDPTGTLAGIHFAHVFSTTMIGLGAGDDVSVFKRTSATDPTLAAVTGVGTAGRDNTGGISCIVPAVMGSFTAAQGAIFGRAGAAPRYVTDANGTVGATGHANLNPTWGVFRTFVNDDTLVFYANGGLWTLQKDQAISAAPVQVQTGLNNGGFTLGDQVLASGPYGGVVRLFLFEPNQNTAAGALAFGSEVAGVIKHFNVEGTDPQLMSFAPILKSVNWACKYRSGILATDLERWAYHDGANLFDLYQFEDRPGDSDREWRCRGGWRVGQDFYGEVNHRAVSGGSAVTRRWVEKLGFEDLSWNNASEHQALGSTGDYGVLPGQGGLPWSDDGEFMYTYADGSWRYFWFPKPGYKVFSHRKTAGAAAASGRQVAAGGSDAVTGGVWTSPLWELPGLAGKVKAIGGIEYGGYNRDSGTPTTTGSVVITAGGQTATFRTGFDDVTQVSRANAGELSGFDLLQVTITITQQTGGTDSSRTNINALPVLIRGWAWDEEILPPTRQPSIIGRVARVMNRLRGRG